MFFWGLYIHPNMKILQIYANSILKRYRNIPQCFSFPALFVCTVITIHITSIQFTSPIIYWCKSYFIWLMSFKRRQKRNTQRLFFFFFWLLPFVVYSLTQLCISLCSRFLMPQFHPHPFPCIVIVFFTYSVSCCGQPWLENIMWEVPGKQVMGV